MSEQTFVQQLVQESLPVWEKCLHSEFLTHLADGTLDEACFKGYIVEDSLYLREYAKVFAWGMTKAKDMQTIRTYYSLLSFVNESEDAARLHYLKHFGLTDEGIQSLPLRPENRAYVDSMIEAAKNGEAAAAGMSLSAGNKGALAEVIIGEISHKAAGEGGQVCKTRAFILRQNFPQRLRGVLCFKGQFPGLHHAIPAGDFHFRVKAEKGVAAPLFAGLGTFQQIAVGGDIL